MCLLLLAPIYQLVNLKSYCCELWYILVAVKLAVLLQSCWEGLVRCYSL